MLPKRAHTGQAILFAGLLVQTLALAAALAVLAITYVRAGKADRTRGYSTFQRGRGGGPSSPLFKLFLAALPLAGACVLVRCAYRTAATWGGIGSPIAKDLLLWLVAEGALLTEAMVSLAAFHPALCLDDVSGDSTRTQDLEAGRQEVIGKRYSSGTTMSMRDMYERKLHDPQQQQQQQHLGGEGSQLMFSSNVMAPSEAGSSDAAGSRRGSAGVLDANPYYRYEDPFRTPSPQEHSPYDAHFFPEDITAETRGLSPMEAEAEEDRLETESFVQPPRKSSKRQSRNLSLTEAEIAAEAADVVDEDESFIMPPRKSSKRVSTAQPPARGLSVRSDDDSLEVASFILPSRKPSKMSTMRREEDLDAVSLYSQ